VCDDDDDDFALLLWRGPLSRDGFHFAALVLGYSVLLCTSAGLPGTASFIFIPLLLLPVRLKIDIVSDVKEFKDILYDEKNTLERDSNLDRKRAKQIF